MSIPSDQQPLLPYEPANTGRDPTPDSELNLGKNCVTNTPTVTVRYRIVTGIINRIFSAIIVFFGHKPLYNSLATKTINIKNTPANANKINAFIHIKINSWQSPRASYGKTGIEISIPGSIDAYQINDFLTETEAKNLVLLASMSPYRGQEIKKFYDSCLQQPIYKSLSQKDRNFLKEVLIPHLLVARDELIQRHKLNPGATIRMREQDGPSLINFKKLVENAVASGKLDRTSYFSTLPDTYDSIRTSHQLHFDEPSRTPMSVKIYPDGHIKFVIPHKRSVGSVKKVSYIIDSHIINPSKFTHLVKLSGHKDLKNLKIHEEEMRKESAFAKKAGVPLYEKTTGEDRFQAYAKPRIPLSSMLFPTENSIESTLLHKTPLPLAQVCTKVNHLFQLVTKLLEKIKKIDEAGFVHSDIKPENILVEKTKAADGSEHLEPFIIDFGGTTKQGEPTNTHTRGYYLPGQQFNTRGADLFALGKTFDDLLALLYHSSDDFSSCKYSIEGLSPEKKNLVENYIKLLHIDFKKITTNMEKRGDKFQLYGNESLKYEDLIQQFINLKAKFDYYINNLNKTS